MKTAGAVPEYELEAKGDPRGVVRGVLLAGLVLCTCGLAATRARHTGGAALLFSRVVWV